ncbi:MAG: alkaline phosphatase family protein [Bacteroidota bacterium]
MLSRSVLVLALTLAVTACSGLDSVVTDLAYDQGPGDGPVQYVIHVSVDGLRPDAVTRQLGSLPAFSRLRAQGAFTDNARTDATFSNTLPNHTAQLTGRGVSGPDGHGWTTNTLPAPTATLHSNRGAYVASAFDVAHDHGLRTGLYASKPKFVLYERSYGAEHGAPDTTGPDDGRAKIDTFVVDPDTKDLVARFVAGMQAEPLHYAFVHLRDPDAAGHLWGWRLWGWHPYMKAVRYADGHIGTILDAVLADPRLAGRTAVIVTSDHGGSGHSHLKDNPEHYTVPFYVWGPGVPAGDLYDLNPETREDPGEDRPGFGAEVQPIRNGAVANLALGLLGLPPVPGSTINTERKLRVRPVPEPAAGTAPGSAAPALGSPAASGSDY